MRPRDLSINIEIDENSYTIKNNSSIKDIPNTKDFDSLKIITYCPYCLSKYELEYSGFLPTKIGYKCDSCDHNIILVNNTENKKQTISTKYLSKKLKKHLNKIESFSCGYNYTLSSNDDKLYKRLKRGKYAEIFTQLIPLIFFIPSLIQISLIIQGEIPHTVLNDPLFFGYHIGLIILTIIIMVISIKKIKDYTNIKDSVLNKPQNNWVIKGIEKGKEDRKEDKISEQDSLKNVKTEYN